MLSGAPGEAIALERAFDWSGEALSRTAEGRLLMVGGSVFIAHGSFHGILI
jgi:hypothetical protein